MTNDVPVLLAWDQGCIVLHFLFLCSSKTTFDTSTKDKYTTTVDYVSVYMLCYGEYIISNMPLVQIYHVYI